MATGRLSLIRAVFILIALGSCVAAQTMPLHEAELLLKDGETVRSTPVRVSADQGVVSIFAKRARKPVDIKIPISEIKRADYTYSKRPQIWEGIATAATISLICYCGGTLDLIIFLPFAFTKIKTHWMVIETEKTELLLKLGRDDYRQLMLEMHKAGINVVDSGKRPKEVSSGVDVK